MAKGRDLGRDLREYLEVLEAAGELKRITTEVDWKLEAGAISRLACERCAPAPMFENIRGYPGQRMAAVLLGPGRPLHARVALGLGLEDRAMPALELIEHVRRRFKNPQQPVRVDRKEAPCKEVVIPAEQVNLLALPIPWIKGIDGGRYLGTWDIVVTRDPQTGWTNWAIYRCMVKDEKRFAILLMPSRQHGGQMLRNYEAMGKPMPLALVIGAHPTCHLAAMTPFDSRVPEGDMAGGLLGAGVPVVKCETIDLEVPANAEMIIEAEVVPGERVDEGPFGEYTGHSAHRGKAPVAVVKCITHRRNPIHTMANPGKPYDDYAVAQGVLFSALVRNRLESQDLPVKSVYYHAPGVVPVISLKPEPGLIKRIVASLLNGQRLITTGAVFVDEDVDVTSLTDVWWAITTRMHPKSYEVGEGMAANPLIPWLTPEEREKREASYWIINATFPHWWSDEYRKDHTMIADFRQGWADEIKDKVIKNWREYGYEEPIG